jgi:hypothetical protein
MYLITIAVAPVAWPLMFQTKEKAEAAFEALHPNTPGYFVSIADDFGQIVRISTQNIGAVMFEDLDQSRNAHIERALHEGRLRANLQTRAKADPVLRHAQMSGPAMISPMGNGFNG